ncbi:MAG: hypothetical protein KGH74_03620 [Candidatus Micrarchaeota archaeon]|nr:hypothetical protein [Candidatus Micrarchaeota archaeon]
MTIIGLLDEGYVWGVFPAIGGIIGLYFSVSLLADGSITQFAGTSTNVLASASTNVTSAWQFLALIPITFTISAFLIAGYKVTEAF